MYSTIHTFFFPNPWPEDDIIFNPAEHYQSIIKSNINNKRLEKIQPSVRMFEGSIDSVIRILEAQCNEPSKADGFHISINSIDDCTNCFELTGQFWKNYWGSRHCDHWISGAISTEWLGVYDTSHFTVENRIVRFKRDGQSNIKFVFPNGQINNYTIASFKHNNVQKTTLIQHD